MNTRSSASLDKGSLEVSHTFVCNVDSDAVDENAATSGRDITNTNALLSCLYHQLISPRIREYKFKKHCFSC